MLEWSAESNPYREQDRADYLTKRQREQAFMYSFPTKKLDKPDAHVRRACKQPFSSGNPNLTVVQNRGLLPWV